MKVLLTGANGYIGTRLLHLLIEKGHEVVALVRHVDRLNIPKDGRDRVTTYEGDLMNLKTLQNIPKDIDAAYYLVHAMSDDPELFADFDLQSASYFVEALEKTACKQIIYLGGLSQGSILSKHLASRREVERILKSSRIPLTVLRASIIIGSGSASFEIIRDLTEKLPLMVSPKWVKMQCQPIAISDVLAYLHDVLGNETCFGKAFEIAGPERISYKDMLLRYAKKRGLKRAVLTIPILTPRLSSYWLIFITKTNFYLAKSLIDSVKSSSIKIDDTIDKLFPRDCLTYEEAVDRAIQKIEQNEVISSWRDAWSTSSGADHYAKHFDVPKKGCLTQITPFHFSGDPDKVMDKVFTLGGKEGYYMNWAWWFRGEVDKTFGGVGLRRGKTERKKPRPGDALDFWRVLVVDEENRRLLLYAEMRVPGEAWLELNIESEEDHHILYQTATFRPKGVFGRLYWYALYPIHILIFRGMGKKFITQAGANII